MGTAYSFQAGYLHAMTREMLMAADTPRHIAENVAEILVNANLAGHDSHGVIRIPSYLQSITDGKTQPSAEPTFLDETPNTLSALMAETVSGTTPREKRWNGQLPRQRRLTAVA